MTGVGLMISLALILNAADSGQTSLAASRAKSAQSIASACAEEALQQIRDSASFIGTGNIDFQSGSCTYEVTSQGGQNRTITASSTVQLIVSKVRVVINAINPSLNVIIWEEIEGF